MAPKGGGLVLKDGTDGRELCKMSALGLSYKEMVQGFEGGFPGHPSSSMADYALGKKRAGAPKPQRRSKPSTQEDDFDIIDE